MPRTDTELHQPGLAATGPGALKRGASVVVDDDGIRSEARVVVVIGVVAVVFHQPPQAGDIRCRAVPLMCVSLSRRDEPPWRVREGC
jgi:hypothetical protein